MIKKIELEPGQLYQLVAGSEIQLTDRLDTTFSTKISKLYGFDIFIFLGRKMPSSKSRSLILEHAVILAKGKILFTPVKYIVFVKKL